MTRPNGRVLLYAGLAIVVILGLWLNRHEDQAARYRECVRAQEAWDGREVLANQVFAPPGSTPVSEAVLTILERVGFTPADIATLIANGAKSTAAKLAQYQKVAGPRPTC